jgi:hypothetical protein
MAKTTVTLSLDVEAAGPIPGPWWMCSFGICRTDDVVTGFKRELKPLVIPGLSEPETPGAMRVVSAGLKANPWVDTDPDHENIARVRSHFERAGSGLPA